MSISPSFQVNTRSEHENFSGEMAVKHDGNRLPFKVIEQRPAPVPVLKPPRKFKRLYWQHRRENSPWGKRLIRTVNVVVKN
jgi:hypothetical protein